MELRNDDLRAVSDLTNELARLTPLSTKSAEAIEATVGKIASLLCLDVTSDPIETELERSHEEEDTVSRIVEENIQLLMDIQRTDYMIGSWKQLLEKQQEIFNSLADSVTDGTTNGEQSIESVESKLKLKTELYLQEIKKSRQEIEKDNLQVAEDLSIMTKLVDSLEKMIP